MKTTLDLPDDLMREVKARAAQEGRKLKDAVAGLIRKGMAESRGAHGRAIPKPARLRSGFVPTTGDIEAAIAWGRELVDAPRRYERARLSSD